MTGNPKTPIAAAMMTLKEYRDTGVPIHEALLDVAEEWGVSVELLRQRAEESWGAPLETDRERHAAHFEDVADALDIGRQARALAKLIYELNLPYVKEQRFWEVNWPREISKALESANLDDPVLARGATEQFMEEADRYEAILKRVRSSHA